MRRIILLLAWVVIVLIAVAIAGLMTLRISSLQEPGRFETWLATGAKHFVIRRSSQMGIPPPPANRQSSIAEGNKLFGAECAACHGIDGRTPTDAGRWMYPRAANLVAPLVSHYTDNELFWIVRNGIRFSGMPAFGKVESDEHIWNLVQYVEMGKIGEIVGYGRGLMKHYHNQPQATEGAIWRDERGRAFFRTGDMGRLDEDGYLYILDRKKDMIISGGFNVFAVDIEAVLARHPAVAEACVVAIPNKRWGESPLALILRKSGATAKEEEIREWANSQLAKHQRILAVEFREELPRNAIGKVLKNCFENHIGSEWKNLGGMTGNLSTIRLEKGCRQLGIISSEVEDQ